MPLSTGRHYLAIPGPSVMPDEVLQAMHRPAPNIYTGELLDLAHSLRPDLKAIARTEGHVAMYIANGHAMWEASLMNVCARGDKVLVLATGRFGIGWGAVATALGIEAEVMDFGNQATIDFDRLEARLRADGAGAFKAVLVTHVDTAVSIRNDIAAVSAAIKAAGHDALLMVDCIASLACEEFAMDDWGADVMIAASQKGLMTPPGMGFIFFNDRAKAAGNTGNMRTPYWEWERRADPTQLYEFFDGTAPTHHLFGLRKAVDMILAEGLQNVTDRHATIARAYWAAVAAWGQGGSLRMNLDDPALRSHAVSTLCIEPPMGVRLRNWLTDNAGITLGIPLNMVPEGDPREHGYFRIGHMGHINAQMALGVIGSIDAGLKALGVDHGAGASDAAARVFADAAG